MGNETKGPRMLDMYAKLSRGEVLRKKDLADVYGISPKTVQRDIDELRCWLAASEDNMDRMEIHYDGAKKGYVLTQGDYGGLTHKEILALCKILLESRSLETGELHTLLGKLIRACPGKTRETVEDLVKNEAFYYVPPRHGKKLLDILWDLSLDIREKKVISFTYTRQDGQKKEHTVKPVSLLFSEFYFYLVAYLTEDDPGYPIIFRVDRITNRKETGAIFRIPYRDRFNDGEFRKRVQFMYTGPLTTIRFTFSGPSLEAILDRLPTAKVISEKDGVYTLSAETYGDGILMWLKSQGDWVHFLK